MSFFEYLHPMSVHFPIALLILYSVLEIISIFKDSLAASGFINLVLLLGVVGLVAAVLTGNLAAQNYAAVDFPEHQNVMELIETHESWATATVLFFTAGMFSRIYYSAKSKMNRKIKIFFIVFALAGTGLLIKTAGYGGKLVYKYGIGTEIIQQKLQQ